VRTKGGHRHSVVITRPGAGAVDGTTRVYTPAAASTLYSGTCRVTKVGQTKAHQEFVQSETGETNLTGIAQMFVPRASSTFSRNDVATVTDETGTRRGEVLVATPIRMGAKNRCRVYVKWLT